MKIPAMLYFLILLSNYCVYSLFHNFVGVKNVKFSNNYLMQLSDGSPISGATINYVDGDVVEYLTDILFTAEDSNDEGQALKTRLGVVAPNCKEIYPLCVRDDTFAHYNNDIMDYFNSQSFDDSDKELILYYDEDSRPVVICDELALTSGSIYNVVHEATYSQRIVEDRISNPHGEHAEDVWIISFGHLWKLIHQDGGSRVTNGNKSNENRRMLGTVRNKRLILPLGEPH